MQLMYMRKHIADTDDRLRNPFSAANAASGATYEAAAAALAEVGLAADFATAMPVAG